MIPFAPLLQIFFTDYLLNQRDASPNTIASYRDSFCLLLRFARDRLGKAPADLFLDDVDAPLIGAFLDHLEQDRGSGPRTRNSRLSAIRSFFRHLSFRVPERSGLIQRVLAIPQKRCDKDRVLPAGLHESVGAPLVSSRPKEDAQCRPASHSAYQPPSPTSVTVSSTGD